MAPQKPQLRKRKLERNRKGLRSDYGATRKIVKNLDTFIAKTWNMLKEFEGYSGIIPCDLKLQNVARDRSCDVEVNIIIKKMTRKQQTDKKEN